VLKLADINALPQFTAKNKIAEVGNNFTMKKELSEKIIPENRFVLEAVLWNFHPNFLVFRRIFN